MLIDVLIMRVALAQLNPVSGDIDGNADKICAAIAEAGRQGADLLVVAGDGAARLLHRRSGGERRLPGRQRSGDRADRRGRRAASPRWSASSTTTCTSATTTARCGSTTPPRWSATAGSCSAPASRCSPTTATSTTSASSRPGESREPVEIPTASGPHADRRLDLRGHVGRLLRRQAAAGARRQRARRSCVNLNASPFYPGKRHERDALIRRHVAQVRRPLVYVNTVGAADNGKNVIAFDGESLVYDGHGRLIAIGRQFEEELLVVDLGEGAAPHATAELPPIDREREIYDALVMGLRDYMRKTQFTETVVPVSGGIDSALVLAIAVDAVGPDHVRAYNLPSPYNTGTTPVDRRAAGRRPRGPLRRHSDLVDRRGTADDLRAARPPDSALADARESARPDPRPADDGGVERHRRAAAVLRQRDRDRARLRHALRRHVRRHLGDRRPVEDRRLPARPARQHPARPRDRPGRDLHAQAVGRARRGAVRSRSTTT